MMINKKKDNLLKQRGKQDYESSIGDSLNFGAAEAYKLLRTNINFSLPDVTGCKIIGVTSSLRGEGKSTTAINIAYTMAQTGQRVLLLEADLRLPTVSKRLNVNPTPGLSNLLVEQHSGNDLLQKCDLIDNMRVITAGDIPPNPAELINSDQMEAAMKAMAKTFDVIIVDLPPVSVVSDALIMSRLLSGMIVVVREGMCSRSNLKDTMRQLKFTDCKLLGFVMTHSGSHNKKYSYYKKGHGSYGSYGEYGHSNHKKEAED